MLDTLNLNIQYRSNHDNIYKDFYKKCLDNSIKYDRAAGYFTSESLKLIAKGLDAFLIHGGKIRIVANPKLKVEDIKAIEKGHVAKEDLVEQRMLEELEISYKTIEDQTLNILSWLIFNEQLEIKIAYTNNNAIYHEKFGVFIDERGNAVSFSGSANETYHGLGQNFEKIDVYFGERDMHRIENAINDFEELWDDKTNGLRVIDLPTSIREKMLSYRSDYSKIFSENKIESFNEIKPREYQKKAIELWEKNNNKGILEMATGTGKTITSLLAAKRVIDAYKECLLIVVVPYQHLIDQWYEDIEIVLKQKVLKCMKGKQNWYNKSRRIVQDFNLGLIENYVFLTTYDTAGGTHFKEVISRVSSSNIMMIADECHNITQASFENFPIEKINFNLGLSATPNRWWDEEGTIFMKDFIGNIVYRYTLEEAIKENKLTPYIYHPHIVEFNESEMESYNNLTRRIIGSMNKKDDDENTKSIEGLLSERVSIISKAENKYFEFFKILKKENLNEITHTLVYCAPGEIDWIVKEISKLGIKVGKIDYSISNKDRRIILDMFAQGDIQIIVAIKCLDEGIDIPATKTAYFLASTSNPREFVQRRGRILRKFKGKSHAVIHDFIVLPFAQGFDNFKKIASKELPRFAEFSGSANNYTESQKELREVLDKYNLVPLLYKKPWDVYKEMKENFKK
ncbi:DEAD/DEAH box helicase family protein [Staphylococcus simulans]|uniref:DEAD/DEAH box helicase family protein n=1 Tax=Staphylococcus simulans TaxID=1286 RepID=UPI0021D04197|nr:DEAD/DEAH box helicase family protein [Staphylococcus simulans]UXR50196.1 DEAD/DEAH box helicase family protein [Staphylococcus simulans]